MNTPTDVWTPSERLAVIAEISSSVLKRIQGHQINYSEAYSCAERIKFLATESPGFLEQNREAILNGWEWERRWPNA